MTSDSFSPQQGSITSDAAVSPDGTENAYQFIENTDPSVLHRIVKTTQGTDNVESCFSVYLKANGRSSFSLHVFDADATSNYFQASVTEGFNLAGGSTSTGGNGTVTTSTLQDVGNGWYRFSVSGVANTSGTGGAVNAQVRVRDSGDQQYYTGDGSSGFYYYGFQFEAGSTPSSYIPNEATTTRAAETFTIPSANLPWPSPQYIGSELVTNGTFDTDSDWTKGTGWSISGGTASSDGTQTANANLDQTINTTSGSVYHVTFDLTRGSGGLTGSFAGHGSSGQKTASGSYEFFTIADSSSEVLRFVATSSFTGSVDNVSVREINPLSVSIGMEGRASFADEDADATVRPYKWEQDGNNLVWLDLDTNVGTGDLQFNQIQSGTYDKVQENSAYSPDILVPYNIAVRHGSTFVNGAYDGVALTANTTPTALPDLSSTDLNLAYDYMGTISEFRVWDKDLGDAGIVEATNPSLEPSLSLEFSGLGTSSFTVSDWAE
jgi:hypothetical protein